VVGHDSWTFFLQGVNASFNLRDKAREEKFNFCSKINQVRILTVIFFKDKF
jgi:hypothetical protein